MPAINFQKQFADAVESGEKRQTIRRFRKDATNPLVGDTLFLFTGQRTEHCRLLREVRCTSTSIFEIHTHDDGGVSLMLDLQRLTIAEGDQLAKADGFAGVPELLKWFEDTHGLPFVGLLIKWGEVDA